MEEFMSQVTPYLVEFFALVLIAILTVAMSQLRKFIKTKTSIEERFTIIALAKEVVDYVTQVGVRNGASTNGELWSMAINMLLEEMEKEGIEMDENTADLHIEAAYRRSKGISLIKRE